MSNIKNEVFIASRFEEFKMIRELLNKKIVELKFLEAIDLNNNKAGHRSPLSESLFHVRKSEIMILLVGESYGTIPEGETLSYTHLEYREAIKESNNTRILVFCIGKSYEDKSIDYSTDQNMKKWQQELGSNHRLSKFGADVSQNEVVEKIMVNLLTSIYELEINENFSLTNNEDDFFIELNEDGSVDMEEDLDEAIWLDKNQDEEENDLREESNKYNDDFSLLKIPNKLASIEQKKEADWAIKLKEYPCAIKHLKKSLDLRPLDFGSNYWLGKMYLKAANKNKFYSIEECLLRAAKIAEIENQPNQASKCYQLIVQATIFSDKEQEGFKYIEIAENLTPAFAKLHLMKTKFLLHFDYQEQAKESINQAFKIKSSILKDIARDPFFRGHTEFIKDIKYNLKSKVESSTNKIIEFLNSVRQELDLPLFIDKVESKSIYQLLNDVKKRFAFSHKYIAELIRNIDITKIQEKEDNLSNLKDRKSRLVSNLSQLTFINSDLLQIEKGDQITIDELNILIDDCEKKGRTKYSKSNSLLIGWIVATIAVLLFIFSMYNEDISLKIGSGIIFLISLTMFKANSSFESKKNSLNEIVIKIKDIKDIEERINKLEITIENEKQKVHKTIDSFNRFEKEIVQSTSARYIPYKALKKAKIGSISLIRATDIKEHVQNGYNIIVKEDFPDSYNIKPVRLNSNDIILGKILMKNDTTIEISRFKAYDLSLISTGFELSSNAIQENSTSPIFNDIDSEKINVS